MTLLGAAGEKADLEKHYKANTSKMRTLSLFRQGCMYDASLPGMREEWAGALLENFIELLRAEPVFRQPFFCEA